MIEMRDGGVAVNISLAGTLMNVKAFFVVVKCSKELGLCTVEYCNQERGSTLKIQ